MKDEAAAAIAARAEAATPGPWHITAAGEIVSVVARRLVADALMSSYALGPDAENADFIAHAREDIPALLAERAALREILQAVVRVVEETGGSLNTLLPKHEAIIEQARAQLAEPE